MNGAGSPRIGFRRAILGAIALSLTSAATAQANPADKLVFKYQTRTTFIYEKTGVLHSRGVEQIFGSSQSPPTPMTGLVVKRDGVPLFASWAPEMPAGAPLSMWAESSTSGQFVSAHSSVADQCPTLPVHGAGSGVMLIKYQGTTLMEFDHLDNGGQMLIKSTFDREFKTHPRRDAATLTSDERQDFVNAVVHMQLTRYPNATGNPACEATASGPDMHGATITYRLPGNVTHFAKYDEIHSNAMIHGTPNSWAWHRELMNRFEIELQEFDPLVTLPYWNWATTPPAALMAPTMPNFMGNANGPIGEAWALNGFYKPSCDDRCVTAQVDPCTSGQTTCTLSNACRDLPPEHLFCANDAACGIDGPCISGHCHGISQEVWKRWNVLFPPKSVDRNSRAIVENFSPEADSKVVWCNGNWPTMSGALSGLHGLAHDAIGGTVQAVNTAARDPMFFLLHSNVDRLVASWQQVYGPWNPPSAMYSPQENTVGWGGGPNGEGIQTMFEPWANLAPLQSPAIPGYRQVRPWTNTCCSVDGPTPRPQARNSANFAVTTAPIYDVYVGRPMSCP